MSTPLAKLGWYWNRLRLMGPAEIAHRVRQGVGLRMKRVLSPGVRAVPAPALDRFGAPWCAAWPQGLDAAPVVAAADRILAGRWTVFALHDAPLGFPPVWNRDPLTGTDAPMTYGPLLDYRDEKRVGNIKYLWEPSRHLELVTLAQAWRLTGKTRFLDGCGTLLGSWFDACPYPLGPHWASSLESALRLVNWAVAWHLLGGVASPLFASEAGVALRDRWLAQAWRHQAFVAGHLSRHSSANNHLLGECMGLVVAGLAWPCWQESARWLALGHATFEAEALRQNWEDGVNKEQGIYYHHEVADMMLLCGLFARANESWSGVRFGAAYWQRLEAMLGFIDAMTDAGGHVPMFGDADDALMVRFDPRPAFDPYRSLCVTGARLFGRPEWQREGVPDPKTAWLLGDDASPAEAVMPAARSPRRAFPQGGYWLMGEAFGTPDEVHLVADAGPLGYLSIAAHGHADALAGVLSLGGRPVLIDPGTYAYHTQKRWRNYFRGTSAHNTVRVDGLDQSVIGGNFMWLHKARARCLAFTSDACGDVWVAEHDGYRRLPDPLRHRRRIERPAAGGRVRLTDTFEARGTHAFEWHWHFAPHCQVSLDGGVAHIEAGDWRLVLACDAPGAALSLHCGEDDPPLGWISTRFDQKHPVTTLRCAAVFHGAASVTTELRFERIPSSQEAKASLS